MRPLVPFLIAAILLAGCRAGGGLPTAVRAATKATPAAYDAGSVLVRWKAGATGARPGYASRRSFAAIGAEALAVPAGQTVAGALAALRASGQVAYAEPNYLLRLPAERRAVRVQDIQIDPIMGAQQRWGQTKIGMEGVWPAVRGNSQVVVAVLDTGVDLEHPDLRTALVPGYSTFAESSPQDYEGHGTHVAGIVAGQGAGQPGVKGVAPGCRVMPVKVMGPKGREGKVENVVAGLFWAVDHGAKVINMSLGDEGSSALMRDAIAYAQARDVLVVAASGNFEEGKHATRNTVNYPAAYPGVMAVGATDEEDVLADFSFWGPWLSVTAPGVDVHSSVPGDDSDDARQLGSYQSESGTSMAAPFVAGLAGLVRSRFPQLTAVQVRQRIESTAHDLGAPGYDPKFGHGRIDAAKAVLGP